MSDVTESDLSIKVLLLGINILIPRIALTYIYYERIYLRLTEITVC